MFLAIANHKSVLPPYFSMQVKRSSSRINLNDEFCLNKKIFEFGYVTIQFCKSFSKLFIKFFSNLKGKVTVGRVGKKLDRIELRYQASILNSSLRTIEKV